MSLKYLVLPGIGNSDENHWQTIWEKKYGNIVRIQQANWDSPNCADWVNALEKEVSVLGENLILIAHSLSCLLVSHWASKTNLKIAGALLVAPPDPNAQIFPKVARSFSDFPLVPFDFISTVVASDDDPYASIEFSQNCAASWGAEFVKIASSGHINTSSGFGDWPYGEALLEKLIVKVSV